MIVTKRPITFRIVVIPQQEKKKEKLDQEQWFHVDRVKLSPGLLKRVETRVAKRRPIWPEFKILVSPLVTKQLLGVVCQS